MENPLRRQWQQDVTFTQEDEALRALVSEYGHRRWKLVASKLRECFKIKGRTGKQLRERWINHLSPRITDKAWTADDEAKLFDLHRQLGNQWKEISKLLGHSDNSVKNHFYSSVRRNIKAYNRSNTLKIDEDIDIKEVLRDEGMSRVLLQPNFQAKKRSKPAKVGSRRSERRKSAVKYQEDSSDEEVSEECVQKVVSCPAPKTRPTSILTDAINEEFEALSWTHSPYIYSLQSPQGFTFPEENHPDPLDLLLKGFDFKSPKNENLPDFTPIQMI